MARLAPIVIYASSGRPHRSGLGRFSTAGLRLALISALTVMLQLTALLCASFAQESPVTEDTANEIYQAPPAPTAPQYTPTMAAVAYSPEIGPLMVGITFSRLVDHSALEARINKMAQSASLEVWDLRFTDSRGVDNNEQTTAAFTCEGLVDWETGRLALEPFIDTFSDEPAFRVAFFLPALETFSGPVGSREDDIEVRFNRNENMFEYQVLNLALLPAAPANNTPAPPPPPAPGLQKYVWWVFIGAIILPIAAIGVVIAWLWYGKKKRSREEK